MQTFSTYRIVDCLQAIIQFLDVAFRVPLESWWMGREALTTAIICVASPLFSRQVWLACLNTRQASGATYDQHDSGAVPSGYEGPQSVPSGSQHHHGLLVIMFLSYQ